MVRTSARGTERVPVQREYKSACEEKREKKETTMWDETEGGCVGGCERWEGGEQKQKA